MYYLLPMITGILLALNITTNGYLSQSYGIYTATAIIHFMGLVVILLAVAAKGELRFVKKRLPWWGYMGGVIGVVVTVMFNAAFGAINVSAILALNLLGQSVASICVDQFGWFGMKVRRFNSKKIGGLCVAALGIALLLAAGGGTPQVQGAAMPAWVAVLVCFFAGMTGILNRSISAYVTIQSSARYSTLVCYAVGTVLSVILVALGPERTNLWTTPVQPAWVYAGGIVSTLAFMFNNISQVRIPALYLTMLLFVSQALAGVAIDAVIMGEFSWVVLGGALLVGCGFVLNVLADRKRKGEEMPRAKHNRS